MPPDESTVPRMRAIQQLKWGGSEHLHVVELDRPEPQPTEILVRVKAAGVNPIDAFTCQGHGYMSAVTSPFVPGWDVAGIVEAVGYGVTRFKPGDEVYGMPWFPRAARAYAEFVTAPSRQFALKPGSTDFVHAAALPLAALTAWQMLLDVARIEPGMRVLINGAAGGVGHLAVQIAKSRGATVFATARTEKHGFLAGLGADHLIDYRTTPVTQAISNADVVIELVGADVCIQMLRTLRKGGLLISAQAAWAPTLAKEALALGVRASWYLVEPDGAQLEIIARMVDAGGLRIHVEKTLPLDQAREAHALVASRRMTGKVVLTV